MVAGKLTAFTSSGNQDVSCLVEMLGAVSGSDLDMIAVYEISKAEDVVDFIFLKEKLDTPCEAL